MVFVGQPYAHPKLKSVLTGAQGEPVELLGCLIRRILTAVKNMVKK